MRVASLHVYPIKGVRAVDPDRAQVEVRGLAGDRRWLFVGPDGTFITQRTHPKLATITARLAGEGLLLSAPGMNDLAVTAPDGAARMDVTVWDAPVNAALAFSEAHEWVSEYFSEPLRLVYMDSAAERLKTGEWVKAPTPTSFADAYPILIATTGSLSAVNAEIEKNRGAAISMRRFRPNVVLDCDDPWREDFWKVLRIGAVEIDLVKPCDRCVVTTKDQATGESMGKEPLASLARIRRSADPRINGVLFGWNAAPRASGDIAVGDRVEILEERPEGFPIAGR